MEKLFTNIDPTFSQFMANLVRNLAHSLFAKNALFAKDGQLEIAPVDIFGVIPREIAWQILSRLDITSLAALSQCSRNMAILAHNYAANRAAEQPFRIFVKQSELCIRSDLPLGKLVFTIPIAQIVRFCNGPSDILSICSQGTTFHCRVTASNQWQIKMSDGAFQDKTRKIYICNDCGRISSASFANRPNLATKKLHIETFWYDCAKCSPYSAFQIKLRSDIGHAGLDLYPIGGHRVKNINNYFAQIRQWVENKVVANTIVDLQHIIDYYCATIESVYTSNYGALF